MTKRQTIAAAKLETRELDAGRLRLGRLLIQIQESLWYDPCSSMKEWVEVELKFSYRTAMCLMKVARRADSFGIPGSVVERVGWWKFYLMADTLTPNWKAELAAVETTSSTKLERTMRGNKITKGFGGLNKRDVAEVDRALGTAKAMLGVETETEALLAICRMFLLGT
jgi:hypothetical protein